MAVYICNPTTTLAYSLYVPVITTSDCLQANDNTVHCNMYHFLLDIGKFIANAILQPH